VVGVDGQTLLRRVDAARELPWLHGLPAVQILRAVWAQQYRCEQGAEGTRVRWRTVAALPLPGDRLESPYDPAARFATKRSTVWRGYKVHLTETCDADSPHLITDVQTTPAPLPDGTMTPPIEQALFERELLPAEHFVDAGYTEADWLVGSQRQRGLTVVGPVRTNGSWQRAPRRGMTSPSFSSTGSVSRPAAHKDSAGAAGRPPMSVQATPSSRSSSRALSANAARSGHTAPIQIGAPDS
jgi:transposase